MLILCYRRYFDTEVNVITLITAQTRDRSKDHVIKALRSDKLLTNSFHCDKMHLILLKFTKDDSNASVLCFPKARSHQER